MEKFREFLKEAGWKIELKIDKYLDLSSHQDYSQWQNGCNYKFSYYKVRKRKTNTM